MSVTARRRGISPEGSAMGRLDHQRSKAPRQAGVAALELGLLLPLLVAILLGIIDYGWVYFTKLTLTNAAREGARVGVTRDADSAQEAARTATLAYLTAARVTGAVVEATVPSEAEPSVRVRVTVNPFAPLVGFVPTPSSLSASSTMRWELAEPGEGP
jgi:Flp pilus assembly protein TadG